MNEIVKHGALSPTVVIEFAGWQEASAVCEAYIAQYNINISEPGMLKRFLKANTGKYHALKRKKYEIKSMDNGSRQNI